MLSYVSVIPLLVNVFSAAFCLGCSAIYHLYSVKSETVKDVLIRLDYAGISVLIFGTTVPVMIYSFSCHGEFLTRWIWFGVCLALNTACFVMAMLKQMDSSKFRPVRGIMYMAAGLSSIGIFITLAVNQNENKMAFNPIWYIVGGVVYCLGATNYILRMPERFKPGTFDYCGASHQIFHCAVLLGCAIHFWQNWVLFDKRQVMECPMRI